MSLTMLKKFYIINTPSNVLKKKKSVLTPKESIFKYYQTDEFLQTHLFNERTSLKYTFCFAMYSLKLIKQYHLQLHTRAAQK